MNRFGRLAKPALLTVLAVFLLAANLMAFGNSNVAYATGNKNKDKDHKVKVCHVPPGNPGNAHVIEVDWSAWKNGHTPHNSHNLDFLVDENHPCPPSQPTPTPTPTTKPDCHKHPKPECKPTPTPKPTPTDCPKPTPTPEPEPTPTTKPEPTPTPQPEVTPTPTPEEPAPQPCIGCGGWPGAPVCDSAKPDAPVLLSINRQGTSATLSWTAVEQATHYSILYGLNPGEYIYGVVNTGNVTSYTINELDPNTKYYFTVRAVNNCMPSDDASGIGGGQVLGATTMAATGNAALLYLSLSAGVLFSIISLFFFRFSRRVA